MSATLLRRGASRLLFAAAALGAGTAAQAVPIVYSFAGIASGTLTPVGGTAEAFSDKRAVFTLSGDTDNVSVSPNFISAPISPGYVVFSIAGLGNGWMLFGPGLTMAYVPPAHRAVLYNQTDLVRIDGLDGPGIAGYAMKTSIGPLSGPGGAGYTYLNEMGTSLGVLQVNSFTQASFQSALAVPEPATALSLLAGLAGLAAWSVTAPRSARRGGGRPA
jgi:hypothetical protein